jgi:hypothetical protein
MFEYCSAQTQIVVGYPEDFLMLIVMRHNATGRYLKYTALTEAAAKGGIPVVKALEGCVVRVRLETARCR